MGCKGSKEMLPPPYCDEKLQLEAANALHEKRCKLWKNSYTRYEDVFFMFPTLKKGSWPVLNLEMEVYEAAADHFKKKNKDVPPTPAEMKAMYDEVLKFTKTK